MKPTLSTETINIPDKVTVEIKARKVRVKGPRGVLTRDFKHLSVEMEVLPPLKEGGPKRIRCQKWFGTSREIAAVNSVCSHINNMFTGVLRGYKYTMKLVYAHFPINVMPSGDKKLLEIRNFLGEKVVRKVPMKEGVTVDKTGNKDEICLTGNSIENVGSSASLIHQVCMVKRKDIRKFLDGVYVSEKSNVVEE
jgi:large subunit ribosomal protein L9e